MKNALGPTAYCDYGHPAIAALAQKLRGQETEPAAIAQKTFHFVRDRIVFGFDLYKRTASETLRRGYGACWNKALLLAGLLRCHQIPARLGSIPLKRSFVAPAIGRWHRLINDPYYHSFVYARLSGRWTILDPVLDCTTYAAFFVPAGVGWGIDWDAVHDMSLYRESVAGAPRQHADMDTALDEKMGNTELPRLLAIACNAYLNRRLWRRAAIAPVGTPVVENTSMHASGGAVP